TDLSRGRSLPLGAVFGIAASSIAALRSCAAYADDAPGWPAVAFKQTSEAEAPKRLYGKRFQPPDKVKLEAPEIAENGAMVPVSVSTTLPDVTSISILVKENPYVLAASYRIPAGTLPAVSNRLKMAKTSEVLALVESGGKLYSASK